MTFQQYIDSRKYGFGRGSPRAWSFIAHARGDSIFSDAGSWREVEACLALGAAPGDIVVGARSVWKSFCVCRSRLRPAGERRPRQEALGVGAASPEAGA